MRLQATGVSKSYGATRALRDVRLHVAAGEIHALLGENGAGKSTLLRILGGEEHPDRGLFLVDGKAYSPGSPFQARRAGICQVSETRTLADDLTVEENLLLGLEPGWGGWIARRQSREIARLALAQIDGEPIPLHLRAGSLSCGEAQRVEIARALLVRPKVLLLDEPTRSLSHWEIAPLFETLRRLAERGVCILFISHFLEEAQALCSRYTLLRNGERVACGRLDEVNTAGLIRAMSGRDLPEPAPRPRHVRGKPLLELKKVSGHSSPCRIDLTLHEGEILGLAGLDGAGRSETLRAIFGLASLREGEIWRGGKRVRWGTPNRRLRAGIGLTVEDRREGILPSLSLADNLTLSCLGRFGILGFLSLQRQDFAALDWMEKLHVWARSPRQPAGELSGGNQQKVILARLLLQHATVLLLDEPTRGIDLPTKGQIHEIIAEIAHQGKGILLVSSDPAELLDLCDTIALLRQGRLVETRPASEWTQAEIIATALGPP